MGFLEIVGYIILIGGAVATLVGGLMFLIAAFRQSGAMGCGMMIPFLGSLVQLYFILTSWDEAKKPLFIQIAGMVLVVLGGQLADVSLDSELDSELSGYYEEYYEESYEDGEEQESGGFERNAELEAGDTSTEEASDTSDTFGAESSREPTSISQTTPQRLVRQDRRASRREQESQAPNRVVGAVPVGSLDQHLGRQITIVKTSGKTVRGKLIRVSAESVTVEKRLGGGKMAFPIPKEDIDSAVLGR